MEADCLLNQKFEEHNLRQRVYFERPGKRTIVPKDSLYLQRHIEELIEFGKILREERVLEVGCGMGRYTLLLAERGIRVTGLDLSPILLDKLHSLDNGRYSIPLYCADILYPPLELQHKFDVVIGFFTLHHLHNISMSLSAMAGLLNGKGRILFLEPNPFNPLYYLQMAISPSITWEGDGGMIRMRRNYMAQSFQQAGFLDFQIKRFGFFPPFLANYRSGARVERILERFWLWKAILPFQIFKAVQK